MSVSLRGPQDVASHITSTQCPASIRSFRFLHAHPSYPPENLLFILRGFDNNRGELHHAPAHLACAIMTDNRFDGYLAESRDGQPLNLAEDGLLTKREYYFLVPSTWLLVKLYIEQFELC